MSAITGSTPIIPTTIPTTTTVDTTNQTGQVSNGVQGQTTTVPDKTTALNRILDFAVGLTPTSGNSGTTTTVDTAAIEKNRAAIINFLAAVIPDNLADMIAELVIEQAQQQRDQALESRLASRQMAKSDLLEQANKMDSAAVQALVGAVVAFAVTAIASGISIGGSASTLGKQVDKIADLAKTVKDTKIASSMMRQLDSVVDKNALAGLSNKVKDIKKEADLITQQLNKLQNNTTIYQGIGQIGSAAGNMTSGTTQSTAKFEDAEGSRLAAMAEDERNNADTAKQIFDNIMDMMNKIISFLKEMQDNEIQMMQAITRA